MNASLGAIRGIVLEIPGGPQDFFAGFSVDHFSKRQVVRSGKAIRGSHPTHTAELIEAFKQAHAWRDGHLIPMRRVRSELSRNVDKISPTAITAGRLKRFQSIRRKLKRGQVTLYQMQDIAGVRAIMPNIASVQRVVELYKSDQCKHALLDEDDYLQKPKADGYRSHHLVLKYTGLEEVTGGNRIAVELQVRTRLQHAWATAVEAVGMVAGQNIKGGGGDADWRRFFVLMAAEFAAEEGLPMVPGVSSDVDKRRVELVEVSDRIEAVTTLESYNQALKHTEDFMGLKGNSYLIQYNPDTRHVSVRTFSKYARMSEEMFNEELLNDQPNTVLVEIDKVDDLREAYPNYFLDVRMFTDRLKRILFPLRSMSKQPESALKPASKWAPILDWIRDYGSR